MAVAVAVVSVTDNRFQFALASKYAALVNIAISAPPATYATGGLVMNLLGSGIKSSRTPIYVEVFGQSGYVYLYVPGTDASNGLLKIFVQDGVSGNPLAEMANATSIPAGVSGDTIQALVIFQGME